MTPSTSSFASSASMTWGINLDLKTRFLPNIFYDIAGGDDYNSYSAAGIILGPIIIPLYQSWEEVGPVSYTHLTLPTKA